MIASGKFNVDLTPQDDGDLAAGRMLISKSYLGDVIGSGRGQMISKRTDGGAAVYYAIEEFSGSVQGRVGAFTLAHAGHMTKESQALDVAIVEGSGTGQLQGISGTLQITQDASGHSYVLAFAFADESQ